jgi:cell wall assembly regulator SMI1
MTRRRASFAEFIKGLAAIHQPSVDRLSGAASEAEIRGLEAWLGVTLPEEARDIYALHNGSSDPLTCQMIFGRKLLSISQILSEMGCHADIRQSGIVNDTVLDSDRISENFPSLAHVPIFSDDTGNFIGYDLRPSPKGRFGQVLAFGADIEIDIVFDSINEFWGGLLNEMDAGNWTVQTNDRGLDEVQFLSQRGSIARLWA